MSTTPTCTQCYFVTYKRDAQIPWVISEERKQKTISADKRSMTFGLNRTDGVSEAGKFLRRFKPQHPYIQQLDALLASESPNEQELTELRDAINAMEWTPEELLAELVEDGADSIVMNSVFYRENGFFHTEVSAAVSLPDGIEPMELSGETVVKQIYDEKNVQFMY
ncbi:hypothetical protein N6147_001975 [Proteus mirabilis]|nr:hypothetical protein [Proteus mirabilis]